jgi:hypothetical protein
MRAIYRLMPDQGSMHLPLAEPLRCKSGWCRSAMDFFLAGIECLEFEALPNEAILLIVVKEGPAHSHYYHH